MKELVGTFNQEKALVEAFSVIMETDGSFTYDGIVLVFGNNSCSTISALAAYLYKLLQDEELFLKYFEWRKSYNVYRWHFI